ncbi:hypothetical protein BH11PLA1_BH11PLA1_19850 [soil metagenome]
MARRQRSEAGVAGSASEAAALERVWSLECAGEGFAGARRDGAGAGDSQGVGARIIGRG